VYEASSFWGGGELFRGQTSAFGGGGYSPHNHPLEQPLASVTEEYEGWLQQLNSLPEEEICVVQSYAD